jgi:fused signal recognition particle receptor
MFKRLLEKFDTLLGRAKLDEETLEQLEELLIEADTHPLMAQQMLDELQQRVREQKAESPDQIKEVLKQIIAEKFHQEPPFGLTVGPSDPTVYLFVGVNGVGKTTTIAKVAALLKRKGFSVLMAAGDTFRAAAIDQLAIWAERTGAQIVKNQPGSDSGSVIFDAIQAAKARRIEFVLADTAGRQHSKNELMQELSKVVKVTEKALGRKPDEILLVLDANTGQNAVRQAEEFLQAASITGLVLTKLDGTARGGALLGLYDKLKVPIKLIGIGEKPEDLLDFKPERFTEQLFD